MNNTQRAVSNTGNAIIERHVATVKDELTIVALVDNGCCIVARDETTNRFVRRSDVELIRIARDDETVDTFAVEAIDVDPDRDHDCELQVLRTVVEARGVEIEQLKDQVNALAALVARLVPPAIQHVTL